MNEIIVTPAQNDRAVIMPCGCHHRQNWWLIGGVALLAVTAFFMLAYQRK